MFNKHSVFFTLGIGFVISITLLLFTFFTIIELDKSIEFKNIKNKYITISKIINQEYDRFGFTNNLREILDDMDLILIESPDEINHILKKKDLKLLINKRANHLLVYIFTDGKDNFLHIQTPFDEFIIIDPEVYCQDNFYTTVFIFIVLLLTTIFVFYTIYKKLSPLNELKAKIDHIGDRDMQLSFLKENAKDEVSLLAHELLDKSNNLNKLSEARNIFIRNIMHELKTPITKGRFLTELSHDEQNKQKLIKVFYQLESLINEFASIEEVIATNKTLNKKEYFFDDILENTLDILMLEDETKVNVEPKELKLNVNFKLFTIVVKNLIDNALKYSKDHKVDIVLSDSQISFKNKGEKLKHPLENYFEPFFDNVNKENNSFGLGLYIVKSILDAHEFELDYKYENGENIFIVRF